MTFRSGIASLLPLHLLCAVPAVAQQWTADVYAGGTRYDALASVAGAANIVGNLRVESPLFFGYISGAAPVDRDAPLWSALGGGIRLRHLLGRRLRLGIDAGADGYVFRYSGSLTGKGMTTHAMPLVALATRHADLQLRGGRRDHHLDGSAGSSSRHMYEGGVRGTVGSGTRVAVADARVLTDGDRTYPTAHVQLGAVFSGVRVWGSAGRWFSDDLRQTVWGAGAGIDIGTRGELWASVRRDAEPLYQTPVRTSWNVGYSMKLGDVARTALPAPALRDGAIIVRLPRDAAAATPSVAGEFSDWQPLPMRASGDEWRIEIPAGPGVYRFAFVGADGQWFVPEGYPGRMDDDMGGYVAIVVVP